MHIHGVYDTDKHFKINHLTRAIENQTPEKACVMQYDHNSERITFELPSVIEGHRTIDCNCVEVHYVNSDASGSGRNLGLYIVDDLQVSKTDSNVTVCSWLISGNATQLVGPLFFRLTFKCATDDEVLYSWSTAIYKGLSVADGISNTEYIAEKYADALACFDKRLAALETAGGYYMPTVTQPETNVMRLSFTPSKDGMVDLEPMDVMLPAGVSGGGGSGSTVFGMSLTNLMESRVITVPKATAVELLFNYSSVDEEGIDDGPGIGQLLVGGIVRKTFSAVQGDNSLDVTPYLTDGTNSISVRVTNSESYSKALPYTVTVAAVSITSSFDPSIAYTDQIKFSYTPVGIAEKTVHFEVDGEEIGTDTVSTSGRQVSYNVPAQTHGAHVLRVWFTCDIEGTTVTSNVLYYNIICVVDGDATPIIAITTPPVEHSEQYSNVVKKYRVYHPTSLTAPITLEVNGAVVANLTVDRTEQTWTYRPTEPGELVQTIRCGSAHASCTQNITESAVHVEAETEDLALYLSSYGRSNNEENPGVWQSGDIACVFNNFNFISDGWLHDEQGNSVLRVTGDARLHIPYQMFASDFRSTGKTIEFELATREVLNYDTEVVNCHSGDRGFTITAQQLQLTSEQSHIGTRYKEDEHLRVTFVVEKKSGNRLLLCYINGIMSGAVQYPDDDDFSQTNPVGITIGSNYCTTDLYNIRAYDNDLTRHQVLDNWIADTQDGQERIDRFQRNNIYDAYGRVVIDNLPNNLCYLVLQADALPQFKGDKKTCSGYFVDLVNPKRSFEFSGAEIDVQGTSSQYYYRKNYKIKFKGGFILTDGTNATVYSVGDNAVPVDTFTMKADVASSEGAFNVVLSMLYNDLCPYKTPAQVADPRVRQTIEGFPIVIFWAKGNEMQFLGKYNFNNDKATEEVFGFKSGDESWEILQNGTDRVGWHSDDFSGDGWKTDFEARYPEDNTNIARLQQLAAWLVSTDTDKATGVDITPVTYNGVEYTQDTAEYRLAKFSAELKDHFVEEAVIFYYLFTEIFLSIDQREKNAFPTYLSDIDRWIVLFYDADSSCGTDNKGNLAFDYYLEDIDYTEGGDPIYNGQNSVLWKNLRATRYDEIAAMYRDMRVAGQISYESVIGRFNEHQSTWPEAIFNEDMYIKCLEPLIHDGDGLYLPMLQGKKEHWMKWWLYNRFRYLDSKYVTGTAMTNRVNIRAHQKANVFLTSYTNMYGHVYFNAADVYQRMERGREYEFEWPASGAEDPVIGINDADRLTSLGDLSPLMVELVNVAGAPHITSLKIGDGAEDYRNYNMNSITLGNNVLLRTLDCRNCPNLTMAPDVSGCTNIEEIYFDGSSITGLKLPNGGILKKLHLPGTVKNLTLLNQTALTDFQMPSFAGIETLRLENNSSVIDPLAIFAEIPANSRVRITGIDATFEYASDIAALYDRFDTMRGLDEGGNNVDKAQISGTIHIDALKESELNALQARYPTITIDYKNLASYLYFYNEDGSELLYTDKVLDGGNGMYVGLQPTKESTVQYEYSFIGWSKTPGGSVDNDALAAVTDDRNLYAVFSTTVRTYTAAFYNEDGTLLQTVANVPYGTTPSYTGSTPTKEGDYEFSGWSPALSGITGDTSYYAKFKYTGYYYVPLVERTLCGEYENRDITSVGEYAFAYSKELTSVKLHLVTSIGNYAFDHCTALEQLVLYTDTVCAIGDGVLGYTAIANGNGYIYVPAALVDAYKSDSKWSAFADQIRAIEDYPEAWSAYSWESVKLHIEQGDYASVYSIGDTVPLDLGSEGVVNMEIVAFDADDKADGSGKAPITWISKELLATSHRMNPGCVTNSDGTYQEGTGAIGGWEKCEMRTYLAETIKPLIPEAVRSAIVHVTKYNASYDTAGTFVRNVTNTDDVWVPSCREVFGTQYTSYENVGAIYSDKFTDNASRIKMTVGKTTATTWWLRAANYTTNFSNVGNTGRLGGNTANGSSGVALGFCT